jgi:hypothetical protein
VSRQITFCVVADGGTDRLLVPIIQWAIHHLDPDVEILEPEFRKRMGSVSEFFERHTPETHLIFMHRDAENRPMAERRSEILRVNHSRVVPVVPVRMSEAWLLFDGVAIARAADRPSSTVDVPKIHELEGIADPKSRLEGLIIEAAGSPRGRRLKVLKQSLVDRRVSVASLIADYQPLESLSAFRQFQQDLASLYPYAVQ